MKILILSTALFLAGWIPACSQSSWQLGGDFNVALPITAYNEAFKAGHGFNFDAQRYVRDNLALGMHVGFSRFVNEKMSPLASYDPKLTVVPVLATIEYEIGKGIVRPYIGGGLGASVFTFSYSTGTIQGSRNDTNASFTLAPHAGVRLAFTDHFMYYVKGQLVALTDGPPAGVKANGELIPFPESDELTGFIGLAFGVNYRF